MDVEKQLYDRVVAGFRTIIRVASGTMPESSITDAHRKLFFAPEKKASRPRRAPAPSGFIPTEGSSSAWNMVVMSMVEGGIYVGSCPSAEAYLAFLFFCHRFLEKLEDRSARTTASYLRHLLSWNGKAWPGYHDDGFGGMSYIVALARVSIANQHVFSPLFGGSAPDRIANQEAGTGVHFNERQWGPIRSFFHPLVFLQAVEKTASKEDSRSATKPKKLWMQVEMDPTLTWTPLAMGISPADRINLSGERFYGALISGWNSKSLTKINIKDARFYQAQITDCDLSSCQVDGAVFIECFMKGVRFGLDKTTSESLRSIIKSRKLTGDTGPAGIDTTTYPAITTGKKYDSEVKNVSFIDCCIVECAIDCATVENLRMERCSSNSLFIMDSYVRGLFMTDSELEWPNIRRVVLHRAEMQNCVFEGMTTAEFWVSWDDKQTIEDLHVVSGSMKNVLFQSFVAGITDLGNIVYHRSIIYAAEGVDLRSPWTSSIRWLDIGNKVSVDNVEIREIFKFVKKEGKDNVPVRILLEEGSDRVAHLVDVGIRFSTKRRMSTLSFLEENSGLQQDFVFLSPQYRS